MTEKYGLVGGFDGAKELGTDREYVALLEERVNQLTAQVEALRADKARLEEALKVILDQVDYTKRNCSSSEQVGAVLPRTVIEKARAALSPENPEPLKPGVKYCSGCRKPKSECKCDPAPVASDEATE